MSKILKTILWIIGAIFVIYLIILAIGFWGLGQEKKTADAIEKIDGTKITLDDVMGTNLPPVPNQKINDSTIAGIDFNNNGIRDDVELAIFKEYPNSAKIRAAELQYAQALQLELTEVFNSQTLVVTLKKEDSAFFCLGNSDSKANLSVINGREKEVEKFVFNTNMRRVQESDYLDKYMTSYSLPGINQNCDINISSLSN